MMRNPLRLLTPITLLACGLAAAGQSPSVPVLGTGYDAAAAASGIQDATQPPILQLGVSDAVRQLVDFKPAEVKFELPRLMDILRDKRHEGWVLAAYPDPKTSQPLIGAGFSLDLPAREHLQTDPLNPHPFLEPSSAELWQAAGLEPDRLQVVLAEFHQRLGDLNKQEFRREISTLTPQITDIEAESLLRVGAIQAIFNAKAYCRNFDHLNASQQMAMTQLVYQMGYNLQEFGQFLALVNRDRIDATQAAGTFWRSVQLSLVQSQWARLYRVRAAAVIAMLDPRYEQNPSRAEHSINGILRPAVVHRRHGHGRAALRAAAFHPSHSATHRQSARIRKN